MDDDTPIWAHENPANFGRYRTDGYDVISRAMAVALGRRQLPAHRYADLRKAVEFTVSVIQRNAAARFARAQRERDETPEWCR